MRRAGCAWESEARSGGGAPCRIQVASDQRFRRSCRLTRPADFTGVFALRRRLASAHFQLNYRPNCCRSARLGVVVPRKLAALAVHRNLLKRICRECFRSHRAGLPECDIVFRLSSRFGRPQRVEVRAEVERLLVRLCEIPAAGSR
ncbi:MAG TPA: ribonuclease P protein component [Rhodocyclaceae bacterium]|nr:MAG: ribonuclease P protein component [Rhodocyclales bacterium CG17_big_fil_post_rev_8_21_14_2_50_68_7]PJA56930.1 MAG: ribonuclease P protein component [Rhodocyclales bacterium CG_4_9_14_3_um_filter_68_10]HCX32286.1 ribonuclease P protein component [Rhodocyclaceae bacterium]